MDMEACLCANSGDDVNARPCATSDHFSESPYESHSIILSAGMVLIERPKALDEQRDQPPTNMYHIISFGTYMEDRWGIT